MTYLDPAHTRNAIDWTRVIVRVAAAASIGTIAWLTLTLGPHEDNAHPQIVAEPIAADMTVGVEQ